MKFLCVAARVIELTITTAPDAPKLSPSMSSVIGGEVQFTNSSGERFEH